MNEKDHASLADLGVNVYRLGTMWPGAEPHVGQFNQTYFQQLEQTIQSAASYGIFSLLDMHQDVLSEYFCGEGIPAWAAKSIPMPESKQFPTPVDDPFTAIAGDGFPTRQDCNKYNWPSYYETIGASSTFDALYTNPKLLQAWGGFWEQVAVRLGTKNNAVLGYELINEPWAGDIFRHPALLVPSVADKQRLQPAYDILAPRIRAFDPNALVFFAAVTWDDPIPVGFEHSPGDDAAHSVFAFHYYNPPQYTLQPYFHQRKKDAIRLQTAAFMTEFERATDDNNFEEDHFVAVASAADTSLVSWTMWEYKTFCKETNETLNGDSQAAAFGSCKTGYGGHELWNEDGSAMNPGASRKLARTYAQKTAGILQSMRFNASTGEFLVQYQLDQTITTPTEIFAHQALNYPDGMDVRIAPAGLMQWKMLNTNIVGVTVDESVKALIKGAENVVVTVSIKRKQT